MFDPIFNFLEKIVTDFSWRRLITFITFLLLLALVVGICEYYTNYFRLGRLERSTNLLKEIVSLRREIGKDSTLSPVFNGVLAELDGVVNQSTRFPGLSPSFWRGLAGASPWLLITLGFIPGAVRGRREWNPVFGGLLFVLMFGLVGAVLPDSWGPVVHFGIYPVGHFLIIFAILLIAQLKKQRPNPP